MTVTEPALDTMDEASVIALIRRKCEEAGGQRAFVESLPPKLRFNQSLIANTLAGRRAPARKLLTALGLERVPVSYRRVNGREK